MTNPLLAICPGDMRVYVHTGIVCECPLWLYSQETHTGKNPNVHQLVTRHTNCGLANQWITLMANEGPTAGSCNSTDKLKRIFCWPKGARHAIMHTICFYLLEILKKVKLIYRIKADQGTHQGWRMRGFRDDGDVLSPDLGVTVRVYRGSKLTGLHLGCVHFIVCKLTSITWILKKKRGVLVGAQWKRT